MEILDSHDLQVQAAEHIPLMKCCHLPCWTLTIMQEIQPIPLTAKAKLQV
jgi:hypothetical protein